MIDIITQIDYALWNGGLPEPMNADKTLIPRGVEGVLEDAKIEIICLRAELAKANENIDRLENVVAAIPAALATARKEERERWVKFLNNRGDHYQAAAIRAMEDDNG